MMVAAGSFEQATPVVGGTVNVEGATPNVQVNTAWETTCTGMAFSFRMSCLRQRRLSFGADPAPEPGFGCAQCSIGQLRAVGDGDTAANEVAGFRDLVAINPIDADHQDA